MVAVQRSFPFAYPKRFSQKVKSYFRGSKRMSELISSNNLQLGYFIAREIENDQRRLALVKSGQASGNSAQLELRIQRGENLRRRFNQLLKDHHDNVNFQLSDDRIDEMEGKEHQLDYGPIPVAV